MNEPSTLQTGLLFVDAPHPASLDDDALLPHCKVQFTRRGGPGGQHRNKVETAVVITHTPTGVVGQASERRSQSLNRDEAMLRLRVELALAVRTSRSADDPPSEIWELHRRGSAMPVSSEHHNFPTILAEVLDRLLADQMEPATVAAKLHTSSSQLVRLLKRHPEAMQLVNSLRQRLDKRPLH